MAPSASHRLCISYSTPSFQPSNFNNYVNDVQSNSNQELQLRAHLNKDQLTFATRSLYDRRRLGNSQAALSCNSKENSTDIMKLKNRLSLNSLNEYHNSIESLYSQQNFGTDNFSRSPIRKSPSYTIGVKQEVFLLERVDIDYKREQKCLMEFKDKINEIEEEYNEILTQQKEKEKRLKERVQKLKKRFQIVVKVHSFFSNLKKDNP